MAKLSSLPEPPSVRVLPKAAPPAPPKSSALPVKASAPPNNGGLENSSVNTVGYVIGKILNLFSFNENK